MIKIISKHFHIVVEDEDILELNQVYYTIELRFKTKKCQFKHIPSLCSCGIEIKSQYKEHIYDATIKESNLYNCLSERYILFELDRGLGRLNS